MKIETDRMLKAQRKKTVAPNYAFLTSKNAWKMIISFLDSSDQQDLTRFTDEGVLNNP